LRFINQKFVVNLWKVVLHHNYISIIRTLVSAWVYSFLDTRCRPGNSISAKEFFKIEEPGCKQGRRVHGCGGSIASLLKNETKYFCQFSISKKYFILQNMNQSKNIYCI
jgi:hypothetical protein